MQGGQIYPIHARGVCKYYIAAICQTGAKKRWQCYFFMDKLEWQNLRNLHAFVKFTQFTRFCKIDSWQLFWKFDNLQLNLTQIKNEMDGI